MTSPEKSPYAVRLDDLVGSAKVAPEEQVTEHAEAREPHEPVGIDPPQLPNLAAGL